MTKKLIQNYYSDNNNTNIIKIEHGVTNNYLFTFFLHSHTCLEICLVLDNNITYSIDNVIYEAKKNEVIVVNPVQEHKILTKKNEINAIFLHIPFFELDNHTKEFVLFKNKLTNDSLSFLLKKFYELKLSKTKYYTLKVTSLLLNIIVVLLEYTVDIDNLQLNKLKLNILFYIENNYTKVSLEEISNHFSYNTSYFSRLFKKLFYITFHEFLLNYRLSKALNDIKYTNLSVEEIAFNNGFNSYFRFSQHFKNRYNTTPTAIRKSLRQNNSN